MEKAFPRGGKKPLVRPLKKLPKASLFGNKRKKSKSVNKKTKPLTADQHVPERKIITNLNNLNLLNETTVKEDMLLLGCVAEIHDSYFKISLPGGLYGSVSFTDISQILTSRLSSGLLEDVELSDILSIGSHHTFRVLSLSNKIKNQVQLTVDPYEVNYKLSHDTFIKGFISSAVITSEEDHGYVVDFGVKSLTSFLHKDNLTTNPVMIGTVIKCIVKSVTSRSPHQSVVQVSCLKKDFEQISIQLDDFKLDYYLPGLLFTVTVVKVLKNGLKVKYNEDKMGYVHDNYLVKCLDVPQNYKVGTSYDATLLYILPTVKFVFFTLRKLIVNKRKLIKPGSIFTSQVRKATPSGLTFNIGTKEDPAKCFVPFFRLPNSGKNLFDDVHESTEKKFKIGKSYKLRILYYDHMTECYVATMNKSVISEVHYFLTDFKCGELLKKLTVAEVTNEGVSLRISSKWTGFVHKDHLRNKPCVNPASKFTIGQKVTARVLSVNTVKNTVYLTMKKSLISLSDNEILQDYDMKYKHGLYMGVVSRVSAQFLLVRFFNSVIGRVSKYDTSFKDHVTLIGCYVVGQLVHCRVISVDPAQMKLNLSIVDSSVYQTYTSNIDKSTVVVGKLYNVKIIDKNETSLSVQCVDESVNGTIGIIPCYQLTQHRNLARTMLGLYEIGQNLQVYCYRANDEKMLQTPKFTLHSLIVSLYKKCEKLELAMEQNAVLPFVVRTVSLMKRRVYFDGVLGTNVPGNSVVVNQNYVTDDKDADLADLSLVPEQVVCGKIQRVDDGFCHVTMTATDCWDHQYTSSLKLLNDYLKTVAKIRKHHVKTKTLLGKFKIGSSVTGQISAVDGDNVYLSLPDVDHNDVTVSSSLAHVVKSDVEVGNTVHGVVIWIDYPARWLHLSLKQQHVENMRVKCPELSENNSIHKCLVLLATPEVIVTMLKGAHAGVIVYLPARRCINDLTHKNSFYHPGDHCDVHVQRYKPNNLIGMDKQVYKMHVSRSQRRGWAKSYAEKRKLEGDADGTTTKKQKTDGKDQTLLTDDLEIKEELDEDEVVTVENHQAVDLIAEDEIKSEVESDVVLDDGNCVGSNEKIALSSDSDSDVEIEDQSSQVSQTGLEAGFNWNVNNDQKMLSRAVVKQVEDSSSSDEEDNTGEENKNRKLTKKEKLEKVREEEEKIRRMEEMLMESDREPQTVDDFDRLVMSCPDDSQLWLKYMSFHLQGTEIEKARAVARRAIKTINFRLEQEKLNVWLALLNLENLYGNEESLKKTLEEALQYNDPYKVHIQMLKLYLEGGKVKEMEHLCRLMLRKYKDVLDVWYDVSHVYMKSARVDLARSVLQRALTTVDKKYHVGVICKFAQLENKFGNQDRSETLYEQILNSYPKRIDIWCAYVDMLVKAGKMDRARLVLDRATSQTLPARKMKTLFTKFLKFEEEHGTKEDVEKVKKSAINFVREFVDEEDEQDDDVIS